jgi:hypothetical protein
MPHVMAYAARNREFGEQWRSRVIERPQTRLKNLLKRGIEQRKIVSKINLDTGLALLLGPMLYYLRRQEIAHPMPKFGDRSGGRFGRFMGGIGTALTHDFA